jgi:hypothetical protein
MVHVALRLMNAPADVAEGLGKTFGIGSRQAGEGDPPRLASKIAGERRKQVFAAV